MPQLTDAQSSFLKLHLGYQSIQADAPGDPEATPKPPVNAEENARLNALPPDVLIKTDLTQCDTKTLFTKANMRQLKDAEFKGEGNPDLKVLMREVLKGFPTQARSDVMQALSLIVGVPPTAAKLEVDYDRFVVVRKQQITTGDVKGKSEADPLDEDKHPDFMASRGQLMFGKVLGDAFGIHEIFAALLNPTGGLVGPGNKLVGPIDALHLSPDNPIALHGTVHDAAGYLNTYHDDGPGYNYLDSKIEIFGTDNCLAGQMSGIAYWVAEAGGDYVDTRVDAARVALEKALKSVRDAVASAVDDLLAVFGDKARDMIDTDPGEALDVAAAINDAVDKVDTSATEAHDTSAGIHDRSMTDAARDKLKAASHFIWE